MGLTAENLASQYGISRDEQDAYALASQEKAAAAQAAGRLNAEVTPIGPVDRDGCVRADTSAAKLGQLKAAFKADGSVTAGNSSPLTDGATATLVCSEDFVHKHNLKPLARIAGYAISGCAPDIMGIGPVEAAGKALKRAGISASDLDVIEMNEAFAAQVLAAACRDLDIAPAAPQPRWWGNRAWPPAFARPAPGWSARRLASPESGRRPLCAGHPMHRRGAGHRDHSGGRMSVDTIRIAAVIGAGVMGSGIAAHLANAGLDVILLDREKPELADAGVARQLKAGGFMAPDFGRPDQHRLDRGRPGAPCRSRLDRRGGCRKPGDQAGALQRKVEGVPEGRRAIFSSNTSTIPLADLVEGMPDRVRVRLPHYPFLQSAAHHAAA